MSVRSGCTGTHSESVALGRTVMVTPGRKNNEVTMDGYIITEPLNNGVEVVQFPAFAEFSELVHAFSTRKGGVSTGHCATMNFRFGLGDEDANVRENYRRIFEVLGIPEGAEVWTAQTHTTNVRVATAEDRGTGLVREVPYKDVDGLVTDVPGLALTVFSSDCVPVYLYDPVRKAIGVCHAGWRGTVGGISAKTAELMRDTYGCDPANIHAVIGPSIGPECFEVGEEVAEEFAKAFGESVILRGESAGTQSEPVKPHVDLWLANKLSLMSAGLSEEHVSVCGLCTMCHPDVVFSHRASAGKRGSNAGFLMMKE